MRDEVVDKETALADFQRFVEVMDLDLDGLDDEDKQDVAAHKDLIVDCIRYGKLIVNDNGEPVYTPQRSKNKEPLTFCEPDGAALMEMDRKKSFQDIGKQFAMMASLTKVAPKTFASMKYKDLKVCLAVTALFLGG